MKQITLTLDDTTLNAFSGSGIKLLSWKCVGNSDTATKPLIWSVQTLFKINYVGYGSTLSVYTAENTVITEGTVISPNSQYAIDTDETLMLASNCSPKVVSGGTAGAVTVISSAKISYTCGLSQAQGSSQQAVPYCSATINPDFAETFYPIDKILLGFSSAHVSQGEYVACLDGTGKSQSSFATAAAVTGMSMLLVDLTASDTRSVCYSIGQGWSNDGGVWAKQYRANIPLNTIVIQGDG